LIGALSNTTVYQEPRMSVNQWKYMSWCVLVSIKDLKTEMLHHIAEYHTALLRETDPHLVTFMDAIDIDPVLIALLDELFTEKQTDMRNAGQLVETERALIQMAIDERHAHELAELLFAGIVNLLGMHIPNITFSNHDGYKFQLFKHDVLIYKS
jgi:hypothetical protein